MLCVCEVVVVVWREYRRGEVVVVVWREHRRGGRSVADGCGGAEAVLRLWQRAEAVFRLWQTLLRKHLNCWNLVIWDKSRYSRVLAL